MAARSTPMTSRILERLSLRKGNKVWDQLEGKWMWNLLDGNSEQSRAKTTTTKMLTLTVGINQVNWVNDYQLTACCFSSLVQMEAARPQIMEKRWNFAFQGLVVERWVTRFQICVCKKPSAVRLMPGCPRLQKTPDDMTTFIDPSLVLFLPWSCSQDSVASGLSEPVSQWGASWWAGEARWQPKAKDIAG